MIRRYVVAFFAVSTLLVAACSSDSGNKTNAAGSGSSGSGSSAPFVIVELTSTDASGSAAQASVAADQGVQAAANVLNSKGGILGRQIKVERITDGGKPDTGVGKLQQRLQQEPKPDLIVPGNISTQGVAYVPVAADGGVVSIGTPSALQLNDPQKYPLNFQEAPSQVDYANAMLSDAKDAGATKLAALSSTSAFGQTWQTAIKQAITKTNQPISYETYADADLDMSAQLQRLRDTGADTLLLQGFGAPIGHVLDSKLKIGWNVPVFCDSTCGVTDLVTTSLVGTPQIQGLKIQVPTIDVYTPPDKQSDAQKAYTQALKAIGPINGIMTQFSFQYDGVMLVAAAAKQANSAKPDDVRHALESLTQPNPAQWVTLKEYHYSPTSHVPTGSGHDFVMAVPTHLVDGQVGAPGSS